MAPEFEQKQGLLDKKAGRVTPPQQPLPKMPDSFLRSLKPEVRQDMEKWWNEDMERWRKGNSLG